MALERLMSLYVRQRELYKEIYGELGTVRKEASGATSATHELVDSAYAIRRISLMLDDAAKELRGVERFLDKVVCMMWVRDNQNTGTAEPIRGALVTGTPDVGICTTLPKRGEAEYDKFVKALGIPDHCVPVINLDWTRVQMLLAEVAKAGKPFPAGVDIAKTYPTFKVAKLPRRGVDFDKAANECFADGEQRDGRHHGDQATVPE